MVVFSDKVVSDLKLYLMEMKDGKVRGDFLFPTSRSKRISPVTVERVVRNIVKRSGLQQKVTPHTFRHTFATPTILSLMSLCPRSLMNCDAVVPDPSPTTSPFRM